EQHLLLAIFIHIVVKKDPEACSGELGGGIGHLLQDPLNVHLFGDALSQPVEDLQVAGVLLYLFLGLYLLADVSRNFGGTYYSALTVLDWRNRDGDIDLVSILMQSPGLKMLYFFTSADLPEDQGFLREALPGDEDRDGLAM